MGKIKGPWEQQKLSCFTCAISSSEGLGEMRFWETKSWQIFLSQRLPGPWDFLHTMDGEFFRKNFAIDHRWELERQEAESWTAGVCPKDELPLGFWFRDCFAMWLMAKAVLRWQKLCWGKLTNQVTRLQHVPVALHLRCLGWIFGDTLMYRASRQVYLCLI